ncbi:exodeoxyribonuclease VII small subunit [Echinicola sp. CAU 1574]|uniref:Exodeoxyribonuclease VII small subunit n=1 Tax=Echinicola arenosa TaxID=2774144 RepID=A0ABR9ATX4_9BACT|nr:exodeoxyribonuclease VII small subunit [Echinicola arenosa]MBD8491328.1 exodeoxyribonuclease VII small subunit [Echinicola arenosa]
MSNKENFSYDKAMARIEEIVQLLEDDEKSIDELSALVSEASKLVKECKNKLRMTEEDILKAFGEDEA